MSGNVQSYYGRIAGARNFRISGVVESPKEPAMVTWREILEFVHCNRRWPGENEGKLKNFMTVLMKCWSGKTGIVADIPTSIMAEARKLGLFEPCKGAKGRTKPVNLTYLDKLMDKKSA